MIWFTIQVVDGGGGLGAKTAWMEEWNEKRGLGLVLQGQMWCLGVWAQLGSLQLPSL